MAFNVYAHVVVPQFTVDVSGQPLFTSEFSHYKRVFVAGYATKLLAQWWGINIKRVYVDPEKTLLVTERQIVLYEILDEP